MKRIAIIILLSMVQVCFGQFKPNSYDTNNQSAADAHVQTLTVASATTAGTAANLVTTIVPFSLTTNFVLGTLAEYSGFNGVFNYTNSYYTNFTSHYYFLHQDDTNADGFFWTGYKSDGNQVLGANSDSIIGSPIDFAWNLVTNGGTVDISDFLTVPGTNFVGVQILNGFSGMPISSNYYVTPAIGNDLNARQGNRYLPHKTLDAAIAASFNNSTFILDGGIVSTNNLTLNPGTALIGQSPFTTIVSGNLGVSGGGNTFQNISAEVVHLDAGLSLTNLVFNNCQIGGNADAILINNYAGYFSIYGYNSTFESAWDTWTDLSGIWSQTNSFGKFYNCNFINDSNYTGAVGSEAINLGPSKFYMYGGRVVFNNTAGGIRGSCVWAFNLNKGTNGYAEFWNVHFESHNPIGTNYRIYNPVGATIWLHGCTGHTNLIYDPSNHVHGVISIVDGPVSLTNSANIFTGTFTGNGSGLTNLNIVGSGGLTNVPFGLVTNKAAADVIVTNAGVATTITSNSITTSTFNNLGTITFTNVGMGSTAKFNTNDNSILFFSGADSMRLSATANTWGGNATWKVDAPGVVAGRLNFDTSGNFGIGVPGTQSGSFNLNVRGLITTTNGVASYASNTLALASIVFPATTVNWTNTFGKNIFMFINNAGVTGTALYINGTQIASTLLVTGDTMIPLQPGEYFSETYTVGTPVAVWKPQ